MLVALAIAPGLAICLYFFTRDVYNREPAINLIMCFVWGMVVTIPAIFLEMAADVFSVPTISGVIISTFLFVAFIEEFCKYIPLRFYAFTRKSFDEPLDGIVYSVMISMGFATIENLGFVLMAQEKGLQVALLRMFTSVPAHASFAVIMGYYVGLAKFEPTRRTVLLIKGLAGATIAHGMYNVFLFLSTGRLIPNQIAQALLPLGAFVSLFIAIKLSRKLIRLHQQTSHQLFHSNAILTIRNASTADIDLIRSIALDAWPHAYSSILSQQQIDYMLNMMYSHEALLQQMKERHQFIVVFNSGVPVGFASFSETEPTEYKLHKLYILPIHQKRGTGKFVIEQIINDILPHGATSLKLNVNRNNSAVEFYQRLGFEVAETVDVNIGDGFYMNDYIMEKKFPT